MKLNKQFKLMQAAVVLASALLVTSGTPALAQDYPPPPSFGPAQLDNVVSRIALYPDPLLAQVFAAASFPEQIPDAARWADQYRNLHGQELADAMYQANLPFDPAVQALIPFPSVLDMLASDMNWTSELGNAVLSDRQQVMDAVQRMRRSAEQYGYLQSNQQMRVVNTGAAVEIMPVDPALIYVPVYDPYIVYAPPRPGFYIGGAIGFGSCYSIGAFGGWGWGGGFNWYNHAVFVNHVAWGRTWYNRGAYIHNYGNWAGGGWRNGYNPGVYNRTHVTINNRNFYGNSGSYGRGGQIQNRGYDRNASAYSGSYNRGGQNSPVINNRTYQGSTYSNGANYNRGSQTAPVTPNRSYPGYSNGGNYGNYNRGSQTAPVTPNRSYPSYSNSGSYGNYNRGSQTAPVTPNRSYPSSTYQNPGASSRGAYQNPGSSSRGVQNAPAPQSRGFQGSPYQSSGSFNRGGGRSTQSYAPASRQAPAPAQNRGGGGNSGGHFDRSSGRR